MKNGIMKICTLGALLVSCVATAKSLNSINKVFHHKGGVVDLNEDQNFLGIELGNVVFYFSDDPIVNFLPLSFKQDKFQRSFFFPMAELKKAEVKRMVKKFNHEQNSHYKVHLEEVEKPIKGVRFTVFYDPEKIDIQYDQFESIGMQKGVVFRFYDKEVLRKISGKTEAILRTSHLKKKGARVAIDCGHGGKDFGTIGKFDLKEKDITMKVGFKVADLLKRKGVNVFFTRIGDVYSALDERTTLANGSKADLFISLHANSAPSSAAHGIETFCLAPTLFIQKFSTLEGCSSSTCSQLLKQRCLESNAFAQNIHKSVLHQAKQGNRKVVDRKVKYKVSQVLLGSHMPAALIELGFLSHEQEAKLLSSDGYQQLLAHGISEGVTNYLQKAA